MKMTRLLNRLLRQFPFQLFQLRPFQLRPLQFRPFQLRPFQLRPLQFRPFQLRPLHAPIPGRPEAKPRPPLKWPPWPPPPRGAAVANGEASVTATKQLKESISFELFMLGGVSNY